MEMITPVIDRIVEAHCPSDEMPENWELQDDCRLCAGTFLHEGLITKDDLWGKEKEEIVEFLNGKVLELYDQREEEIGVETMREFEKVVVLRAVDSKWMDHIDAMDQLASRHSPSCIRRYRSAARISIRRLRDVQGND